MSTPQATHHTQMIDDVSGSMKADTTMAVITGTAGDAGVTVMPPSSLQQQPTLQFATLPANASAIQGLSTTTTTTATLQQQQISSTGQIQYVIQLPVGANGATGCVTTSAGGQPFQIQMMPQQFQVRCSAEH